MIPTHHPAGLPVLLEFYKGAYFHPGSDVPRTVAIADPSEYYVAQAVVTAGTAVPRGRAICFVECGRRGWEGDAGG